MPMIEIGPQALPTIIAGPNGTSCVNPAVFQELIAYSDAKTAVLVFFALGLIVGGALIYARVLLDRKESEEEE